MISAIQNIEQTSSQSSDVASATFSGGVSLDLPKDNSLEDLRDSATISHSVGFSETVMSDKVDDVVSAVLRDVGSQLSPSQVNKLRDVLMTAANAAFSV